MIAAIAGVVVIVAGVSLAAGARNWFSSPAGSAPGSGAAENPHGGPDPSAKRTTSAAPGKRQAPAPYRPLDVQQANACDGVPAVDPAQLRLLDPKATVTAAVVCTQDYADLPGRGRWQIQRVIDVPASAITTLVTTLLAPDVVLTEGACDASLHLVPDFVLTLADGTRIRPGAPGDGCHVRAEVTDELAVLARGGTVRRTVPITQVASEQEVGSGCGGEAKSPAVWLSAGDPVAGAALPSLPQTVSVCRYAVGVEPELGTLDGTGAVPGTSVVALLAHLDAAAPAGCPAGPTPETSPATDWLAIQAPPATTADEPTPAPLLLVELGGCRRVIDGAHFAALGHLPAGAVTALRALADQPVR